MRKYISSVPGWKGNLMNNNEKFNTLLNSCAHSRQIYNALLSFAKPSLQQANDMGKKRQVIIGELLTIFDKSQSDQ